MNTTVEYNFPTSLHLFIDIETNSTAMDAGVWEIGYVVTDQNGNKLIERCELTRPEMEAAQQATMTWIKSQPDVWERYTRACLEADPLSYMLNRIIEDVHTLATEHGINTKTDFFVYSFGQFDLPILNYWYEKFKLPTVWTYRQQIDMRSVGLFLNQMDAAYPKTINSKDKHNALSDAIALKEMWFETKQKIAYTTNSQVALVHGGININVEG
jgi:3' exoribonuclease, RNase T-like